MQRFKNILVVYDRNIGGEATLARATALAKRNAARLTVVEAIESLPDSARRVRFLEERHACLERLIATRVKERIHARTKVLTGIPFIEIIRQVLREHHDLVMLTADGKGMLRELFFGSTSLHLMRKCPCPVWITKPTPVNHYANILAAVDPFSSNAERDALNVEIMDLATSLARLGDSTLHIVHAWELTGNDLTTSRSEITQAMMSRLLRRCKNAHKQRLDRLLEGYRLDDLVHHVHILRGEPGLLIPDFAAKKHIDLIVMGTVCRTGVSGFFIGNAAEMVLRQVVCALLTVKPEKFATPVTLKAQ